MTFDFYHFHIYFNQDQVGQVQDINKLLSQFPELKIGRIREEPVGPHPTGSCQITVPHSHFDTMIHWFFQHRADLDIFVHAVSGDDLKDHTEYVLWIGRSYDLNLDFFR